MQGKVYKSTGSWYKVKSENKYYDCKIKGKFRTKGLRTTNPVTVGDKVEFDVDKKENSGIITTIFPRKNYIIRKSINLSRQAHIIAANIDLAFLMITMEKPVTTTIFIDRFLAAADAYDIPVILVFNKIDLYNNDQSAEMEKWIHVYENINYTCIKTSVSKTINIDKIERLMKDNVSVIAGHSGVGKSSLINLIEPGLELKVEKLSDYHQTGKHTTTFSEMFDLSNGGAIIDTPGIKGFGMVDMEKEEISHYFPEMFQRLSECKFYNCTHTHEPKCAVKKAVADGEIAESRYLSYLNMLKEDESEKYRDA